MQEKGDRPAGELDRRSFLQASGAIAFLALSPVTRAAMGGVSADIGADRLLGFTPVPVSYADKVVVPQGYRAQVLISWGDPVFPDAPAFHPEDGALDQGRQFGDHNDGMTFFPLAQDRGLLAVNHEFTEYRHLFPQSAKAQSAADMRKAQAAHGVSLVEIKKENGRWRIDPNGQRNRRITAYTPMEATGPVAGHSLMRTVADQTGRHILGTINNCANGQTPWGTYLTCEENFHYYFAGQGNKERRKTNKRYGLTSDSNKMGWELFDQRFNMDIHPNEPHRFGWVVEIDPMDPSSIPKKRTALGRFSHENAALVVDDSGHVVVYLGDDSRGEYLYKFVSRHRYVGDLPPDGNGHADRDLLEDGTLYAARFDGQLGEMQGDGHWIPLVWGQNGLSPENGFADQAQVLIFARQAADQVGATPMDRPEWVAVHPDKTHVFCTLTNNKNRGALAGQPLDAVNPRRGNPYGHIVRWRPEGGDHTADTFHWDIYAMAGNPVHRQGLYAGSDNITPENQFNGPDGLGFDGDGRLWIMTDGHIPGESDDNSGDFADMGNNQMLCGDPLTGEIRRFLTGPKGCEITGLTFTSDYRTLFVGIQHPSAHFPGGGDSIPRSSVMMIFRADGGVVGG